MLEKPKPSNRSITPPAIWRQIQNAHERNHAELPLQLGLDLMENG